MVNIYISGKITGNENAEKDFKRGELLAEKYLRENHFHGLIVNPYKECEFMQAYNPSWADYMKAALSKMMSCSVILMLNGWETSKGANIEKDLAERLEYTVIYEKDIK